MRLVAITAALLLIINALALATDQSMAEACTTDWSARWVSQSTSEVMVRPGQQIQATISYQNMGCQYWSFNRIAKMGTWNPEPGVNQASPLGGGGAGCPVSTGWQECNRVWQSQQSVPPGTYAGFTFNMFSPYNSPGSHRLYMRPVIDGVTWMEDYGVWWQIDTPFEDNGSGCWTSGGPTTVGRYPTSIQWTECTTLLLTYDNHNQNVLKAGGQNQGGCVVYNSLISSQIASGSVNYHSPSTNWGSVYSSGPANHYGCTYQVWGGLDTRNNPIPVRNIGEGWLSVSIHSSWLCTSCNPSSMQRDHDYYTSY